MRALRAVRGEDGETKPEERQGYRAAEGSRGRAGDAGDHGAGLRRAAGRARAGRVERGGGGIGGEDRGRGLRARGVRFGWAVRTRERRDRSSEREPAVVEDGAESSSGEVGGDGGVVSSAHDFTRRTVSSLVVEYLFVQ